MKKYACGFVANRIGSNENYYAIYTEEQLNDYRKFFFEKCKDIDEYENFEIDPDYNDAAISLIMIRHILNNPIELTEEIDRAISTLASILPTRYDILLNIKRNIEKEGYLEY